MLYLHNRGQTRLHDKVNEVKALLIRADTLRPFGNNVEDIINTIADVNNKIDFLLIKHAVTFQSGRIAGSLRYNVTRFIGNEYR